LAWNLERRRGPTD